MLTTEERPAVIESLRAYPAGVSCIAWGSGPMDVTDRDGNYPTPADFSEAVRCEHG